MSETKYRVILLVIEDTQETFDASTGSAVDIEDLAIDVDYDRAREVVDDAKVATEHHR